MAFLTIRVDLKGSAWVCYSLSVCKAVCANKEIPSYMKTQVEVANELIMRQASQRTEVKLS